MPTPLLANLIDYAGLFPPAKLPMADAVKNHAAYLLGQHAALLGRFIVPIGRLSEFENEYSDLPEEQRRNWRLSVLAGPDPAADTPAIAAFHQRQPHARIVSVETKAQTPQEVRRAARGFPPSLEVWVEFPAGSAAPQFAAEVKAAGRGAKIRTGGVTPDAFPKAADVAAFLVACRDAGIVAKATAGLHHPLRGEFPLNYESGSPRGTMLGFLNVFLAATLVHTGGNADDATSLLEDGTPDNFGPAGDGARWRDRSFTGTQIESTRRSLCRSFGSCSFLEPIEGLLKLRWL